MHSVSKNSDDKNTGALIELPNAKSCSPPSWQNIVILDFGDLIKMFSCTKSLWIWIKYKINDIHIFFNLKNVNILAEA